MSELRVVILGTSSGKPTLTRGLSAVAVVVDGTAALFDCGEGTQVQFARANLRPSRLVLACLTHFHGDHVNGLPGFLSSMALNQHDQPVTVIGPRGLKEYFRTLRRLSILVPRFQVHAKELSHEGEIYRNDSFRLLAARVEHRIETWGYRLEEHDKPGRFDLERAHELGIERGPLFGRLQNGESVQLDDGRIIAPDQVLGPTRPGRTIAYITDTRPCQASVRLAHGVDLLIHEGTYGPALHVQAEQRGHSTVVDAAKIAQQAGAKQLVLTHISPKHDKTGPLLDVARKVFPNTIIARDLLELTIPMTG